MIDRLLNNFLKYGILSNDERNAIIESTEIKEYKKGSYLLREGQKSTESYFILEGCIRQYSLLNGEEKTTLFFTENDWVISSEDNDMDAFSIHNWVCMEDCTLVTGNEKKAQELFAKFPGLENISRKIVEAAFSEMQKSILLYHTDSPEQCYLKLLQKKPDIFQRVPQYHIASFIGVKPESLSRIRKRIALKKE